jgi:hypothetical protein
LGIGQFDGRLNIKGVKSVTDFVAPLLSRGVNNYQQPTPK